MRRLGTVAEVTSTRRGLAVEVTFDHADVGLDRESVVNCDGIQTLAQSSLSRRLGSVDDDVMANVCGALGYALGC